MNDLITQGPEIKSRIISEISNATQCINLAMAWFTDKDLANAFIDAKNRGVNVEVILSSNQQNDTVRTLFEENGVKVYAFATGDPRGIMHHKFCLIDNRITINGSFNYSYNASTNNVENIIVSDDTKISIQFIDEFNRLKYNFEHQLNLENPTMATEEVQAIVPNSINDFRNQLHNLVFSSTELDTENYKKRGFEKSQAYQGSIEVFKSEYDGIKQEINVFASDESLGSKKQLLSSDISNALESSKAKLNLDKKTELEFISTNSQLETNQIKVKLQDYETEKTILEIGNDLVNEEGLSSLNKKIEKIQLDKKNLERTLIVKSFWNAGTILGIIGLVIFAFYLSIFFGSAIDKLLFEENRIDALTTAGIKPPMPSIVEANAIPTIFAEKGIIYGLFASLFFLIPVLLSNIELFGKQKKWVKNLSFGAGIVIFDLLVAMMISFNKNKIEASLKGIQNDFQITQVFTSVEFWLIFVFGMIPLIITHKIIVFISNAYKNSNPELLDTEKTNSIHNWDSELIELESKRQIVLNKIEELNLKIQDQKNLLNKFELKINEENNEIEKKFEDLLYQLNTIFEEFNSKIKSGKIFTDVILERLIASFKAGFIEYLPLYFAEVQVKNKVEQIDKIIESNK